MSDPCEHDWNHVPLLGCSVCPRCHGVRFHDDPPPEPERAPPAPAIADMLDRALGGSGSFDAIDRRFKR